MLLSKTVTLSYHLYRFSEGLYFHHLRPMFAKFHHYVIPSEIIRAIRVMYDNSKSAVLVDGQMPDGFEVITGDLKVDVLISFHYWLGLCYVPGQE